MLKPESSGPEPLAEVESEQATTGPDLSVEALREADPIEVWRLFRRKDLSAEQQEELAANAKEAQMAEMNERMNRYFSAEAGQREAILDEQIDEWMAVKERMQEYLEEEPMTEEEERSLKERWANMEAPSREERKNQFETAKSENRAPMMAYFAAAYGRMKARGMNKETGAAGRPSGSDSDSGDKSSRRRRSR
jgi:hypothetical protein